MSDHSQLKAAAEAIREGSGLEGVEAQDAMILFDCLTTPDAVLGLLLEIENLRAVQCASFHASGQIKAAASELGFNPAQEEGALEYLIGLASRKPPVVRLPAAPELPEEPEDAIDDSFMDEYHSAVQMRDACKKAIEDAGVRVMPCPS